jgi:hypothetical protein
MQIITFFIITDNKNLSWLRVLVEEKFVDTISIKHLWYIRTILF